MKSILTEIDELTKIYLKQKNERDIVWNSHRKGIVRLNDEMIKTFIELKTKIQTSLRWAREWKENKMYLLTFFMATGYQAEYNSEFKKLEELSDLINELEKLNKQAGEK